MRTSYAAAAVLLWALAACSDDDGEAPVEMPSRSAVEPSTVAPTATALDEDLRAELVAMLERDQAQRTGTGMGDETDEDRTARLAEIIDEHGWPGFDLVGREGEEAAWAIAQHSDLDPAFQAEALGLLRAAVADGQASPGNLAYLEDRVAVSRGEPQTYGTQVGCGRGGPEPSTPIADAATVEDRRAEAGLQPLEDYLNEMAEVCASGG